MNFTQKGTVQNVLISAVIAGIFVFAIVPVLPDVTDGEGISLNALVTLADSDGGGDGGDGGSDGGGDGGDSSGGDSSGGGDSGGNDYPSPVCSLAANDNSITSGQSVTLTWDTANTAEVTIDNGVGSVSLDGSRTVTPTSNTTYTLTAFGLGGSSVTCIESITVLPVVIPGQCVLEITKSANRASASVGETLTYTLNFKNTGTANCTGGGVRVVDLLPSAVEYVSETHSQNVTPGYGSTPVYQASSHAVTWNADTLTPGESGSVTITARVKQPAQCGNYSFENKAKITAKELNNFGTWIESNVVKTDVTNACPVPPVCAVGVSPVTITQGQSANLSWSTSNATTVTFDQGIGSVSVNGSRSVSPSTTTVYTATVTGPHGTVTCAGTVTVTPVVIPQPVCTLDVSASTITRGQSATLMWTTENATVVSLNQGIGTVGANASTTVSPTVTTTYTLTASSLVGGVECVRTITVKDPDPDPVLSCDSFTAHPSTLTTSSGTTTLTWATTNATGVTIDNGVGTVAEDGSRDVFVNANTSFTLTATRGSETRTCTVPVTITPEPEAPRCDSFTVSDSSVRRGDSVLLAWTTTNATNVSLNQGIGAVAVDGSRSVTIDADITYVLTAGNGSATTSCQVSIDVESSGGGGGSSNNPRCELKASDEKIKAGEKVTLTWKNTRTDEIILKDNRGNVLIDTEDRDDNRTYDEDSGSIDIRPTRTTEYTLTAYNGSRKKACDVEVEVEKSVTVTSTRTNPPLVAGISLSRLPYTGFDAGPFLTMVFYTLLVFWALAVAYILVIRRESVLGVSLREKKLTAGIGAYLPSPIDASIVIPSIVTTRMTAPEVSRMEHIPSLLTPPRKLPHGDMASKFAPIGYEALYEDYGDATTSQSGEIEIPNLPVGEIESIMNVPQEVASNDTELLENRAHESNVLMSTDALNFIMAQSRVTNERVELLDMVIGAAKANFPKEDGWIVINKERIMDLLK